MSYHCDATLHTTISDQSHANLHFKHSVHLQCSINWENPKFLSRCHEKNILKFGNLLKIVTSKRITYSEIGAFCLKLEISVC